MSDDTVALCLAGQISPQVALARLLLGGATPLALATILDACQPKAGPAMAAWQTLHRLVVDRPEMLSQLAAEIAAVHPNSPADTPTANVAAFFDRAVAFSPEASVALYSLGDPAILADATAEIVRWLDDQGWLKAEAAVLDIGCGIGRLSEAVAERCATVLGLDVSAGMVAAARERCIRCGNVQIEQTAGLDLNTLADQAFDLVLAIDSFPYLLQAGGSVVAAHLDGASRVLRSGGCFIIMNVSYGRDLVADQADVQAWQAYGFEILVNGVRPFRLWDGSVFVMQRQEGS